MDVAHRLDAVDWAGVERSLWELGYAKLPPLLTAAECETLIAAYGDDQRFRSRIDMERYRFGVGDYKYFARPLPPLVEALRASAYPRFAPVANAWHQALGNRVRFPPTLARLLAVCSRHGQTRPTPLLLHYEAGGYNCLHQDLYGEIAFPLQLTCFLSRRGVDYEGGEFLLVEQRPRAQSRGEALTFEQGEALVFATGHHPVRGARGWYRATMRHGVSRIHRGSRYTLGIIFHDAKWARLEARPGFPSCYGPAHDRRRATRRVHRQDLARRLSGRRPPARAPRRAGHARRHAGGRGRARGAHRA